MASGVFDPNAPLTRASMLRGLPSSPFLIVGVTADQKAFRPSDWADRLLPALPALPRLRQLRLSQLACKSVTALQQLPPQLAELDLRVAPSDRRFQRKTCLLYLSPSPLD